MTRKKLKDATFVLGAKPSRKLKRDLCWTGNHRVTSYDVNKGKHAQRKMR